LFQQAQGLFPSRRLHHLVAQATHDLAHESAQGVFVLHHEDVGRRHHGPRWQLWRCRRAGFGTFPNGQVESEASSAAYPVLAVQVAAVTLDNANGETEAEAGPRASRLRGEERIEDTAQVFGRDTGTTVVDLHDDLGAAVHRSHAEDALALDGSHRVNGMAEQVEKHLLNLLSVS